MKILRVAHHGPVSAWRERERALRERGVDVTLVSSRRWNEGGAQVMLEPGDDDFVTGASTLGSHPSVFLYDPRPIWRALGDRPDLIDIHEEPNSLAVAEVLLLRWLRRSRAPYLLYSAQNIRKRYPFPFSLIERWSLRGAAGAYVCNVQAGEILNEKGLAGGAAYIPLGVESKVGEPAGKTSPGSPPRVAFVGRLEPHKGVAVLLRAVADLPGAQLTLIGEGPDREGLEESARQLGISDRVAFVGHVGHSEVHAHLSGVDVLAVPSLPTSRWLEQFGRVAVEAMSAGIPVVASDTGALVDVVGGAGLLVPPGDPDALAAAILEATAPERWSQLREDGAQRARLFTWQRVAEAHHALYERALLPSAQVKGRTLRVLIVAYGPPRHLEGCLRALGTDHPVVVVDNSGLPATREVAERHGAHYVDAGRNLGFAGGVNLGLRHVGAQDDVLLLNPDARIGSEGVREIHRVLLAQPRTGAVGARQVDPRSREEARVWWPFPSPRGAWIEAFGLGSFRRGRDFAIGSVLALRAEALRDVGELDEAFFLYAEETDWQRRARTRGWQVEVADVAATHEGGATSSDSSLREQHFYRSHRTYIQKHFGRRGWHSYRVANRLGASVRALLLRGDRGATARRRAQLFAPGGMAEEPGTQ